MDGEVLAGGCGSGSGEDCPGDNSNSGLCCQLEEKKGKTAFDVHLQTPILVS